MGTAQSEGAANHQLQAYIREIRIFSTNFNSLKQFIPIDMLTKKPAGIESVCKKKKQKTCRFVVYRRGRKFSQLNKKTWEGREGRMGKDFER